MTSTWLKALARLVAFFAIAIALLLALQVGSSYALDAAHAHFAANAIDPFAMLVQEVMLLIAVAAATLTMARLERQPIAAYGYSRTPDQGALFTEGALYGVAAVAIVGAFMYAFGGFHISGFALRGMDWIRFPLIWLVVMLLVGFVEEAAFRGYPFFTLARSTNVATAAVATTMVFGLGHVFKPDENVVDIASVMFVGVFLCFTVWRTGSLWLAAGFHVAFDYMQFFVIGTRNGGTVPAGHLLNATFPGPAWINGGPLGTEASAFMFPVVIALFAIVHARHRRRAFQAAR